MKPSTPPLRPYQVEALAAIKQARKDGERRLLVGLPTGTGKTRVGVEQIKLVGTPALFLVHRDELVQQAIAEIHEVAPDLTVGVVKAERDDVTAPVVVASVQTLLRPQRRARLARKWKIIVTDEAHHAVADGWRTVLQHFKAFEQDGPLVLGLTATPTGRGDKQGLEGVFERIVSEKRIVDLIPQYLCNLRAVQVHLDANFDKLHTVAGDFKANEAEAMLMDADAPEFVVAAWKKHAPGRRTLVFTPTVAVAQAIAEEFQQAKIPAAYVEGKTPLEERRKILARFKAGKILVLANCGVLTEGYNEPAVSCIVIARPTRSKLLYTQMVGRGTRLSPLKQDTVILDMVGATERHDLMTASTLFGVEADETFEREGLIQAVRAKAAKEEKHGKMIAHRKELFRECSAKWTQIGADLFGISLGYDRDTGVGRSLFLSGADEKWSIIEVTERKVQNAYQRRHGWGGSRKATREVIEEGLDLEEAQRQAEEYAYAEGAEALFDLGAGWRKKKDLATPNQINALHRMKVGIPAGLTKVQASDLLNPLFLRKAWAGSGREAA